MPVNTDELSDIYGTICQKSSPGLGMQTGSFEYQEGKNLSQHAQLTLSAQWHHIFELASSSASKPDK